MRTSPFRVAALAVLLGLSLSLVVLDGGSAGSQSTRGASDEGESHSGDEVCVSAEIPGGAATVCARRDGFGLIWGLSVSDTEDDGRDVTASIALDVAGARDPAASLRNDLGAGTTTHSQGSFRPRFGSAIGNLDLAVCVDIRFLPDRCRTVSAAVPQLTGRASPEQAARLDELVFGLPLEAFVDTWTQGERVGVDADFDWGSDGCSAGPVAPAFEQFLDQACLRHDFAYRNYGQLSYHPTDDVRRRVDEQLAADAETLGHGNLSQGLIWSLQRFAAPVFYGDELAEVWGVPAFLASWLRTAPDEGSTD